MVVLILWYEQSRMIHRLQISESDVNRRPILTSKVDHRTEIFNKGRRLIT